MIPRRQFLRSAAAGAGLAWLGSATPARAGTDAPRPEDDATYRPTVLVRNGGSLGTGTLIASVAGETLVLTAAHVVADAGRPVRVSLYRFNIGVEASAPERSFPKLFAAEVAAKDRDADVAILRVKGLPALPFRARIDPGRNPPEPGTPVTSLGYDRGERLQGFSTRFLRTTRLRFDAMEVDRTFLLTEDPPVEGRSGGGLFLADGTLIGVCVGRINWGPEQTLGLFSPIRNVHRMVDGHPELAASLGRHAGPIEARAR